MLLSLIHLHCVTLAQRLWCQACSPSMYSHWTCLCDGTSSRLLVVLAQVQEASFNVILQHTILQVGCGASLLKQHLHNPAAGPFCVELQKLA